MKLTDEQRRAAGSNQDSLVTACAGSGKTRTLVAKLLRCAEETKGSPRRVACITYTNAAIHEIEHRFRKYGPDSVDANIEIATIHSLCLNALLGNFYWRLPEFSNGFEVVSADDEIFVDLVGEIAEKHRLPVRQATEALINANRAPTGAPVVDNPRMVAPVQDFWVALAARSLIDFTNIVFYSFRLLKENPTLLRGFACRYAWVLVDEFQDTSELQIEILKLLASQRKTRFFLVGDLKQSIFSFAGAKPELVDDFGEWLRAETDRTITGNFRCSSKIVEHAERLIPGAPTMRAIGRSRQERFEPRVVSCESYFDGVVENFLPTVVSLGIDRGKTAILAPQWWQLYAIAPRLRERGWPVVGPGARPYKRHHLIVLFAEQLAAQITRPRPQRIRQLERELFYLVANATGRRNFSLYGIHARALLFRMLREISLLDHVAIGGFAWLVEVARLVATTLHSLEILSSDEAQKVHDSTEGIRADLIKNDIPVDDLTIDSLGLFADPESSVKLSTIHKAKGREFDAVAIIGLTEGQLPSKWNTTVEGIEESRRVLYVGITRARRVLFYFVESRRNPSRFLRVLASQA